MKIRALLMFTVQVLGIVPVSLRTNPSFFA